MLERERSRDSNLVGRKLRSFEVSGYDSGWNIALDCHRLNGVDLSQCSLHLSLLATDDRKSSRSSSHLLLDWHCHGWNSVLSALELWVHCTVMDHGVELLIWHRDNRVIELRRSIGSFEVNLVISCGGWHNRLVVLNPEEGVDIAQSSENVRKSEEPEEKLLSGKGSASCGGVEASLNDDHLEQA